MSGWWSKLFGGTKAPDARPEPLPAPAAVASEPPSLKYSWCPSLRPRFTTS